MQVYVVTAWALEQAEAFDDDERYCRTDGLFDAAVFFQDLARGLRQGYLTYNDIRFANNAIVALIGGSTHLREIK